MDFQILLTIRVPFLGKVFILVYVASWVKVESREPLLQSSRSNDLNKRRLRRIGNISHWRVGRMPWRSTHPLRRNKGWWHLWWSALESFWAWVRSWRQQPSLTTTGSPWRRRIRRSLGKLRARRLSSWRSPTRPSRSTYLYSWSQASWRTYSTWASGALRYSTFGCK